MVERKVYFTVDSSPFYDEGYTLDLNFSSFPKMSTTSSYGVMPARVLGISYPDYLRMCRDIYGAEVRLDSPSGYPSVFFKNEALVTRLARLLNVRMALIEKYLRGSDEELQQKIDAEKANFLEMAKQLREERYKS